jgi:glucokinase
MDSMNPATARTDIRSKGYLAIEVGEIAAWVAIAYGANGLEKRWRSQFITPPSADDLAKEIAGKILEVGGVGELAATGIALWDTPQGERGGMSGSMRFDQVEFTSHLATMTRTPVHVLGAVEAAAQAEAQMGAGRGYDPVVYIHLGREVRCAIVTRSVALLGASGQAGQIGHWHVATNGPRCSCGKTGHLNPLCSSQGLVRLAIGAVSQDDDALAAVNEASGGLIEALSAQRVVSLAGEGIAPLRRLVIESANALSETLTNLALAVDPAAFILAGPLGVAGGLFVDEVESLLRANLRVVAPRWRIPEIVLARLEPNSALTGAWLLARGESGATLAS